MTKEDGSLLGSSDTTGSSWEANPKISGPTVNANGVKIEVPIERGGMVEAAIELGGEITKYTIDTSDSNN